MSTSSSTVDECIEDVKVAFSPIEERRKQDFDTVSSPSVSTSIYISAKSEVDDSTTYVTASRGSFASLSSTIKDFDDDEEDRETVGDDMIGGNETRSDILDFGAAVGGGSGRDICGEGSNELTSGSWLDYEDENEKTWIDHSTKDLTEEDKDYLINLLRSRDLNGLKRFSNEKSGGFRSDEMRRMVWSILVNRMVFETNPRPDHETLKNHPFYNQVVLDVNRSLKRFPPSVNESKRISMQDQLVTLIMRILIKRPNLYYYQGFHDIYVTCLLILGEEKSFYVLDSLCQSHLKSFMSESMESTSMILEVIPILIERQDRELSEFLTRSGVGTIFALSWVITWYSDVLRNYDTVGRLFDLFICSDKLMPCYLAASLVLEKKDDILQLECDMASVFQYLSKFWDDEDTIDFEKLIHNSIEMMSRYDLKSIENEAKRRYIESQKLIESRKGQVRRSRFYSPSQLIFSIVRFVSKSRSRQLATISAIVVLASFVYQFVYLKQQ